MPCSGAEAGATSDMPFRSPDNGVYTGDGDAQNGDLATLASDAPVADGRSGLATMLLVSATMLLLGLGLFAVRWSARRLGDG